MKKCSRFVHGERRVAGPAGAERAARVEEAREHHHARDRQQPVRERVQPRERHVGRAEHERDDVVGQARERRDDEEEDHQRRVHREEAVVGLRVEVLRPRLRELRADDHRQQAAGEQEEDRRHQVLDPDHLVVGVDAEVVPPAVRAVAGVVFGRGGRADRPADPVVEGADARRGTRGEPRVSAPTRMMIRQSQIGPRRPTSGCPRRCRPDPEEERRHPRHPQPPRREQVAPPAGRRLRRVQRVAVRVHVLGDGSFAALVAEAEPTIVERGRCSAIPDA